MSAGENGQDEQVGRAPAVLRPLAPARSVERPPVRRRTDDEIEAWSGAVKAAEVDDPSEDIVPAKSGEMPFLDHLEELRWTIIRTLLGLVVAMALSSGVARYVIDGVLLAPTRWVEPNIRVQNLNPGGQFWMWMEVVIILGLILSLPNTLYQIWRFISPGLHQHERKHAGTVIGLTVGCFLLGLVFGYYGILPFTMRFFASFNAGIDGSTMIENNFDVNQYMSTVLMMLLGAGVIFELPVLTLLLAQLGVVKPALMRKYRRHAVIVIFLIAAIVTPTPDPAGQIAMAVPLLGLYEVSIGIAAWVARGKAKKAAAEAAAEAAESPEPAV